MQADGAGLTEYSDMHTKTVLRIHPLGLLQFLLLFFLMLKSFPSVPGEELPS